MGFHRFYLGKTGTGVLWMLSGGLGMVGAVYDFFTLPRQVEEANIRYAAQVSLLTGAPMPGFPSRSAAWADQRREPRETVEKLILRTAKKNRGVVTPGEVALEGDFSLEEAKKALERMATAGDAEMRVRSSGVVVYVFPEFASSGDDYIA